MPRLILASTSPYRKAQLAQLGVPFGQRAPGLDEDHWKQIIQAPDELALALARAKAEAVAAQLAAEAVQPPTEAEGDAPADAEAVQPAAEAAQPAAEAEGAPPADAGIVAGGQVAALDGDVLDKPGSLDGAIAQLTRLAGRTHQLHSAVAVYDMATCTMHSELVSHAMTMRPLTATQIRRYATRDEPFDCAGSYRIEALGVALFSAIEGTDHSAIIGLPLMTLTGLLASCGVEVI